MRMGGAWAARLLRLGARAPSPLTYIHTGQLSKYGNKGSIHTDNCETRTEFSHPARDTTP
jgi:hypothetical protein